MTPSADCHPAKMSKGLCEWIFDHLLERGWLKPGEVCLDCFGGIGTTGIIGASRGVKVYCVELEPKFAELGKRNFELHRRVWEACGDPLPEMICADSRRLVEVLGALGVAACVGSPPFIDSLQSGSEESKRQLQDSMVRDGKGHRGKAGPSVGKDYGQTPGQLAGLPAGSVEAVVSSPPYASGEKGHPSLGSVNNDDWGNDGRDITRRRGLTGDYGTTPGNIANLPAGDVAAVVSSPPFESSVNREGEWNHSLDPQKNSHPQNRSVQYVESRQGLYGDTDGQLGKEQGATFWEAAKLIVAQCHAILRPGGGAVFVCKDFVRKGQRVPFSADWARLCESVGFELVEWIQASLVKEESHPGLFGEEVTKRKERKSFFRRLAEKKGSPAIDHEDVLIFRKP